MHANVPVPKFFFTTSTTTTADKMFRVNRLIRSVQRGVPTARRTLYTVPELGNFDKSRGIPGLYSPQGLDVAWYQYQSFLTEKLNQLTKDHPEIQDLSTFELMQITSGRSELFEINFYASQAYNNEFFFSSLKDSANPDASAAPPTESEQTQVSIATELHNQIPTSQDGSKLNWLQSTIRDSFDSQLSFRELLINRASGVFGNGHVWLVQNNNQFYVLNTYNHGTPFDPESLEKTNSASAISSSNPIPGQNITATQLAPLVNVNVWQHAFLTDYGVAGKRKFVENVYDCIDWNIVAKRGAASATSKLGN